MKYICLGYLDEGIWDAMSEDEQQGFIERYLAYDAELREHGYLVGGDALQSTRTATTVRYAEGRLIVTDGPFAESKEQLGGIIVLGARDLNHAIHLMAHHPLTRMGGSWEIRPADERINALYHSDER